jgi:hypothetical protein
MKEVLFVLSSFMLLYVFFTSTVAFAIEESSGPLDDHPEWLTCASASECTSVKLGCYYWQPINKNYFSDTIGVGSACLKSILAGPQPTVTCVNHQCVNEPFTVRYWARLESYQKFQLVMSRVEDCRQATVGVSISGDSTTWTHQYEKVLDEQIRNHQFPDNQLLVIAVRTVVPCAELVAWEQGQEKWRSIQSKNDFPRRVVVKKVQPTYSLDNLYPSLVAYAEVYQQCGQASSMAGFTFSGDMHATFTLDAHGGIDPASLKATYPGVAYMRQFIDCASTAFNKLSFLPPENHKTVFIEVLIQVQSKSL